MSFDILNLEPQKVSRDISSYTTLIYGNPKAGKTTFIHELYGKDAIFLRTEKGTKLIPGLFGVDIGSWSDLIKAKKQLKDPRVKERFKVVVIDTVDNLYKFLEKYVKNKYGVNFIRDVGGGFGIGYSELSNHLFDELNEIEKDGYQLVFISHSTTKTEKVVMPDGQEYEVEKYIPSCPKRGLEIMTKMVDNILFAHLTKDPETKQEKRTLYTRETLYWQAGSRFNSMPAVLPIDAKAYKEALLKCIDSIDPNYVKDEKELNYVESEKLDFNLLMQEGKQLAVEFVKQGRKDELTEIVENVLGIGQLFTNATPSQVESVSIIVEEMKSRLKKQEK